jgi:putative ABC transport system ATP-binding protein
MTHTDQDPGVVELQNVSKVYQSNGESVHAVRDVSFNASPGELVLLLGPSGSGKTTLLTLIAGLTKPAGGSVALLGKSIHEYSSQELQHLRAGRLGFVFQNFLLLDSLTVLENVALVTHFRGMRKRQGRKQAVRIMEDLHISHLAQKYPTQLSQGEKQRAAIARALVNEPDLVIADEPTASLESGQGFEIIKLLHNYAKNHDKCVIVASHDLRIVEYADRIVKLADGRLVEKEER